MAEAIANSLTDPSTTLSVAATSGDTSLSVSAPTTPDTWPTNGQFRVRIDSEIIIVTASSSAAITLAVVLRGAEGTSAAAHLINAPVNVVLTKGALDAYTARSSISLIVGLS